MDYTIIENIKKKYGLNYKYDIVKNAYNYAKDKLKDIILEERFITNTDSNNNIIIPNHVCDSDFDYEVTKDDIEIIEFQKNSPYNINDLSDNINDVLFDHPNGNTIITMDNKYPTTSYTLQVAYYRVSDKYSKVKKYIDRIRDYYIFIYLFENLEIYKLQEGLSSKSINGVNIDFDKQSINEIISKFYRNIAIEKTNIVPLETHHGHGHGIYNIKIGKGY